MKRINNKSWLVATKTITKGQEIFWNYRDIDMWKQISKLQKEAIIKMQDKLWFRDNEEENERINNCLQ